MKLNAYFPFAVIIFKEKSRECRMGNHAPEEGKFYYQENYFPHVKAIKRDS